MITLANEVWQMEPNTNSLFHPTLLSCDHPFRNGLHLLKRDLFGEHNPSLMALVFPATNNAWTDKIIDCHLHSIFHPFQWYDVYNTLPDDKILDWSKLKQIADNILKCI